MRRSHTSINSGFPTFAPQRAALSPQPVQERGLAHLQAKKPGLPVGPDPEFLCQTYVMLRRRKSRPNCKNSNPLCGVIPAANARFV